MTDTAQVGCESMAEVHASKQSGCGLLTHGFKAEKMQGRVRPAFDAGRHLASPGFMEHHCEEADVRDRRSFNDVTAPVGSSPSEASASNMRPADDDAGLLVLEMQFKSIVAELRAAQGSKTSLGTGCGPEAGAYDVEIILARLYPVEQGIMQTPAHTIVGLGVKARHAAYVMSQYWDAPIDKIDWDA